MKKELDSWNLLKKVIDNSSSLPTFKTREVWWCRIGLNIGHEENGKGSSYSRPVLILKKFNKHIFWGLPLSTKVKMKCYYHQILFNEKQQSIMLSQIRIFGSERLTSKMGKLSFDQFQTIRRALQDMI